MASQPYGLPLPTPQPESDFYWEKAKTHELWLRHCTACGRAYFYPRDICPHCFSRAVEWMRASGNGTLHAFAIVERAPTPAFADHAPYVAAIVELEEGPRVPTNLVGIEPSDERIKIGMAVEVTFDDVTDAVTLPKFRPAS